MACRGIRGGIDRLESAGRLHWVRSRSRFAEEAVLSAELTTMAHRARWKNRQIPLTLGLLFMAGGPSPSSLLTPSLFLTDGLCGLAAVIMFMEANSYALMVVARILQCVPCAPSCMGRD